MAIKTLCALQKSRRPITALFNTLLIQHPLQEKDRQLATGIMYGILRQQQSLDAMLQHLCSQPLKKLKPFVHQALRVGLFQIIHLSRIPESAAVNESVKAVQAAHLPKQLQGFVNGVLRNAIRRRDELLALVYDQEPPILNHPQWLTKRWQRRYGHKETLRICHQNNRQAAFSIQVNTCVTDREALQALLVAQDIAVHPGIYCENSLILDNFQGKITNIPGFQEGAFQVQDQGAFLLATLLGPLIQGGNYLDACAGVGGKTSVLIQMASKRGAQITAVEPEPSRQIKFRDNMKRLHPTLEVPLFPGTLQTFASSSDAQFHGILLDAPCSGTGVIRRHPDIRWNRRAQDLSSYQETQLELLKSAATLLHPGGTLVYATCSLEEDENELLLKRFLDANNAFALDDCHSVLTIKAAPLLSDKHFAPVPGPDIDGFFGARLIHKG